MAPRKKGGAAIPLQLTKLKSLHILQNGEGQIRFHEQVQSMADSIPQSETSTDEDENKYKLSSTLLHDEEIRMTLNLNLKLTLDWYQC